MEGSELLVTLMGGVALLLWSVRMVRTGMTRAFGASLRSLLGKACSNRAKAFAVGVGVTGLLQSATATALLLASFASRKLVTLAPGARDHARRRRRHGARGPGVLH